MKHNHNNLKGTLLRDYFIQETIGQGTFGKVKLGTHLPTNEKVAIKILEKSKIKEKDDLERVLRELNIIKKFSHPNVVQVYEIIEDSDNYFIIMEYCEGGELFNHIVKKKKLSEEESSYYFYQLINGLEYIHTFNVVHRDLKPENLLLSDNKILKIIDFGLSNFFKLDGTGELLSTPCGSPCYASPEMVAGKKYNGFNIDVWSTGIILYAMLCGYLPFENPDNEILFRKILECNLSYPSHISPVCKNILKKILVTNPEERIKISEIKTHPFYLQGRTIFKIENPSMDKTRMTKRHLTMESNDNDFNTWALSSKFTTERNQTPSERYSSGVILNQPSTCLHKASNNLNSFLFSTISPKNKYQNSISLHKTAVEREIDIVYDPRKTEGNGKNIQPIKMFDAVKKELKAGDAKKTIGISNGLNMNSVRLPSKGITQGQLSSPVHKQENTVNHNLKSETKKSNSIMINNAIINVNMIEPNIIFGNNKATVGSSGVTSPSSGIRGSHCENRSKSNAAGSLSKNEKKDTVSYNSMDFNSINAVGKRNVNNNNNWYKTSDKKPEIKIYDMALKKMHIPLPLGSSHRQSSLMTSYGINFANNGYLSTKGKFLPSISKKLSNESSDMVSGDNRLTSQILASARPHMYINTEVSDNSDKYKSKPHKVSLYNYASANDSSKVGFTSARGKKLSLKDQVRTFYSKDYITKLGAV